MKKIILVTSIVIISLILIFGAYKFYANIYNAQACTTEAKICPDGSAVGRTGPNCHFIPCPTATTTGNVLIQSINIKAGDLVTSPLQITGEARGTWYFEASFPVKIYDGNDKLLGSIPAQAKGDWMTTNFVPFKAILVFEKPTTETGVLVLEKDNPSGLPANAGQIEIPIRFK